MREVPIVAFFNNKGGVGKTSLVYHLAWIYADLGERVLAVDLDPQANLTAALLDEDRLEEIWRSDASSQSVFGAVLPLLKGVGDIASPHVENIGTDSLWPSNLSLVAGDLALSRFEDQLSENWPKALDADERAFRVLSAFWRLIRIAAEASQASRVLVDLGPNLGAINRAALIAADFVVVPLSPDLFSIQGLKNLGPRLRQWRADWQLRVSKNPESSLALPSGRMEPAGYVVLQHSVRLDRPARAYDRWAARVPGVYREAVLGLEGAAPARPQEDEHCLSLLKHYRSLMPMAHEARKPIFHLKPSDGAIGAHAQGVNDAYKDFLRLAERLTRAVEGDEGTRP